MAYVFFAVVWLLIGAVVGVIEARHGGWRHSWAVSAFFGPFSIPLALRWRQRQRQRQRLEPPAPSVLTPSRPRRGKVDLLIGLDGSDASTAAASLALGLFGPRTRRVTLATVLDVDTAAPHEDHVLYPGPWPEETAARALLDTAAAELGASFDATPGAVVLAGGPADALEQYAVDEGYEVTVVGCRGKGLSKLLLGSCASHLAYKTKVPMLVPTGTVGTTPADGHAAAAPVG